jgi:GNAT superfamily N-acetyltransferase
MTFHLRIATPADEAAVSALLHASYSELLAPDYAADLLQKLLPIIGKASPSLLASGTFFVAEDQRAMLLGCGGWTREIPGTRDITPQEAHIRHFATHPSAVRRGVGGALLQRCITEARDDGNALLCSMASLTAEPFYAAFGFRTLNYDVENMPAGLQMPGARMRLDLR